jgi:hypothetical protein
MENSPLSVVEALIAVTILIPTLNFNGDAKA